MHNIDSQYFNNLLGSLVDDEIRKLYEGQLTQDISYNIEHI